MDNGNDQGGSASLSTNPAYVAAFNDLVAAQTPQAKHEALGRMEAAAVGSRGNGGGNSGAPVSPAPAPATGPSVPLAERQDYRDLLAKAMAAPTPQARAQFMAEMERIAQEASASAPATSQGGALEGFEPAQSIGDLPVPPTLAPYITDQAGFEAVREAAVAVGIPKAVWGEALKQAHENLPLLKASEAEWNAHMGGVFAALDKAHGSPEARSQIVRDAAAFLNAVADADPRLSEAADLMRLTPWGLTTAAQLWRSGVRPGKR